MAALVIHCKTSWRSCRPSATNVSEIKTKILRQCLPHERGSQKH